MLNYVRHIFHQSISLRQIQQLQSLTIYYEHNLVNSDISICIDEVNTVFHGIALTQIRDHQVSLWNTKKDTVCISASIENPSVQYLQSGQTCLFTCDIAEVQSSCELLPPVCLYYILAISGNPSAVRENRPYDVVKVPWWRSSSMQGNALVCVPRDLSHGRCYLSWNVKNIRFRLDITSTGKLWRNRFKKSSTSLIQKRKGTLCDSVMLL